MSELERHTINITPSKSTLIERAKKRNDDGKTLEIIEQYFSDNLTNQKLVELDPEQGTSATLFEILEANSDKFQSSVDLRKTRKMDQYFKAKDFVTISEEKKSNWKAKKQKPQKKEEPKKSLADIMSM